MGITSIFTRGLATLHLHAIMYTKTEDGQVQDHKIFVKENVSTRLSQIR